MSHLRDSAAAGRRPISVPKDRAGERIWSCKQRRRPSRYSAKLTAPDR